MKAALFKIKTSKSNKMEYKNQPAFPTTDKNRLSGVSMREYFAIKALQGILSSRELQQCLNLDNEQWEEAAVKLADKLIIALNKKP